jgi:class 3 adenylate cyclase
VKRFINWRLRYKLLFIFLLLGLTTSAVSGSIAYFKHRHSLKQNVLNHLTTLRRSKASQIEYYYQTIHHHVLTLSEDRMFIDAMREFRAAYQTLNEKPVTDEQRKAVVEDYRSQFYPQVQALKLARPRFEDYLPVTPAAFHLQYAYIVKNPGPGQRRQMQDAEDGSDYSRVHAKYHHSFRNIIEEFGYYDLYLIDHDSQRALYDVNKDRDLGTSLRAGPYRESNLAKVVRQCLASDNANDVFFSDFEPYEPNLGEPTQWVASVIEDGGERLGILALQLSIHDIDEVVSGRHGWQNDGLGQSGRSMIVGPDYLVRTNVRSFLEKPDAFFRDLKASRISEETIDRIRTYNTTVLELPMRLPSVTAGLAGKEGTMIEKSAFGGSSSLVSFMPLNIQGLDWMFESRMDLGEAFQPVVELRHFFLGWAAILFLLILIGALVITHQLLRPVNALASAARRVTEGDLAAKAEWNSDDEFGVLCRTFNLMTKSIRDKTELIEKKNRENEALLLNILPGEIADRLKGGENEIADNFADITVLFADLVGFTVLSSNRSASEIVEILNGLFSRFDQVASELRIEKIKTIGDCYMAVCGLPNRCSDHAERIARMALRMLDETEEHSKNLGLNLQMRIGINSGPVIAGVIGKSKFIYDLWGDTVNLASRMESTGLAGGIQVTRSVYERLKGSFQFECRGVIQVKGKGEIETWLLHGEINTVAAA